MAIGTSNAYSGPYLANGSTTAFPFTFTVLAANQVSVILRSSAGVDTTVSPSAYTVSLNGTAPTTGTVTFSTAPASGNSVYILLAPAFSSDAHFADGSAWLAKPVNDGYDGSALRDQVLKRDIGRALLSPIGETLGELPTAAERAGYLLGFDSGTGGLALVPVPDTVRATREFSYTATAGQTSFTLPTSALQSNTTVYANGVRLDNSDFTVAGATVTLGDARSLGDSVVVLVAERIISPGVDDSLVVRVTLSAMPALRAAVGSLAYLTDAGREGLFMCRSGAPPSDPQQGIYVASITTGFYWQRDWDGVIGKPEWFGAVPNSSAGSVPATNYTAITACLALCPVTLLGQGDYFTSATLRVPPYRTLQGQGSYRATSGLGTRIVVRSATADVVAVGLAAYPGSINAMARQCKVKGLSVARDRAVTPPGIGSDSSCACGVRMTFTLHSSLDDVYADDHSAGFYFNGVVRSIVNDCKAFRQTSGTTTTNDFFRGFWCDGGGSYGLSGGNGSLFLNFCNASVGGTPTLSTSVGFFLNNAFVDTTLLQPEATATQYGIQLDGENNAAAPAHIDVDINTPILDAITGTGIEVKNTNSYAAVEIQGGYIGLAGASAFAGYHIHSCQGLTIRGGEVWGNNAAAAGADVLGCYIDTVGRLSIKDLKAIDCKRPFGLTAVADFQIDGLVNNYSKTGSQAAFDLTNCTIGRVTASITGTGGAFPAGISCNSTGNVSITVDPTGVNPACITGGATNKVKINAIAITSPGYFTSAGAGGSSGAGINVIGVTA